jgi:hypothetical protein
VLCGGVLGGFQRLLDDLGRVVPAFLQKIAAGLDL